MESILRNKIRDIIKEAFGEKFICPFIKITDEIKNEVLKHSSDEELLRSGGISIEALDRAAFGFSSEDIKELMPNQLNIKWEDDWENVNWEQKKSGLSPKKYSLKISLDEPIDVIYEDGKFFIDDGHHRYFAAKTLNKTLKVNLEIKQNPIIKLAPSLSYDDFHRCVYKQVNNDLEMIKESFYSDEYIYHGTGKGQALNIQRDGYMKLNKTGEEKPSISFTKNMNYARYYAKSKGGLSKMVILRTKLNNDFHLSPRILKNNGDEYITFKNVPSSDLEIMTDKGLWIPLNDWDVLSESKSVDNLDIKKMYGWYSSFKDRYYKDIETAYNDIKHVVDHNNKQFGKIFGEDKPEDIIKLFNFVETKKGIKIEPKLKQPKEKKPELEYKTDTDLINKQKYLWSDTRGIEIGRYLSKLKYIDANDSRIYGTEKQEEQNILKIIKKLKDGDELPPILLDYDFGILDGHHRWEAAKRLKINKIPVIIYENPNESKNQMNENKKNFLTVYHGTQPKFVEKIKKDGLVDKTGYNQGWYMVSTDFESALFHAHPEDSGDKVYVFKFKIPIEKNKYWLGYPYLWKGQDRSDKSTWFALMQKIPKEFIEKIQIVDYNTWQNQKNKDF